eukprot:Em0009g134a
MRIYLYIFKAQDLPKEVFGWSDICVSARVIGPPSSDVIAYHGTKTQAVKRTCSLMELRDAIWGESLALPVHTIELDVCNASALACRYAPHQGDDRAVPKTRRAFKQNVSGSITVYYIIEDATSGTTRSLSNAAALVHHPTSPRSPDLYLGEFLKTCDCFELLQIVQTFANRGPPSPSSEFVNLVEGWEQRVHRGELGGCRGVLGGCRGVLGGLPGSAGRLPGRAGRLPGRAGRLPGRAGRLPGSAGRLPGRAGRLPGRAGRLPGRAGRLAGECWEVAGECWEAVGECWEAAGSAGRLPGSAYNLTSWPWRTKGPLANCNQPTAPARTKIVITRGARDHTGQRPGTPQPEAGTPQPEARNTPQPEAGTPQPEAGTLQLEAEPLSQRQEPLSQRQEPLSQRQEPLSRGREPLSHRQEPSASGRKPPSQRQESPARSSNFPAVRRAHQPYPHQKRLMTGIRNAALKTELPEHSSLMQGQVPSRMQDRSPVGCKDRSQSDARTGPQSDARTGPQSDARTGPQSDARTGPQSDARTGPQSDVTVQNSTTAVSGSIPTFDLPPGWEAKTTKDGRVYYVDHLTKTTTWEKVPICKFYVRRGDILESSYRQVMKVESLELTAKLYIQFEDERGDDYGGLSREWFHLLSKEMFNPYYGLFEYAASDNYTLQISPNSACITRTLTMVSDLHQWSSHIMSFIMFVAFFIRPFYKMMPGKEGDLRRHAVSGYVIDVELYNGMKYILENDPEPLCLNFSVNHTVFGETTEMDLKPNGRNIPVTEANKKEYVNLMVNWRFTDRIQEQMNAFMKGFGDVISPKLIQVFDERELEYLMGGLAEIDVEDWKRNTEYDGYTAKDDVIVWFWKAVSNYDNEMRARLLQFVTGTSKVPMNGFAELQDCKRVIVTGLVGLAMSYSSDWIGWIGMSYSSDWIGWIGMSYSSDWIGWIGMSYSSDWIGWIGMSYSSDWIGWIGMSYSSDWIGWIGMSYSSDWIGWIGMSYSSDWIGWMACLTAVIGLQGPKAQRDSV